MIEPLFSENAFETPDFVSGINADALMLLYALRGRKQSRLNDEVVFDLSRFKFHEIESARSNIENELREYCLKYIPTVYIERLDIINNGKDITLQVQIRGEDTTQMVMFSIKETRHNRLLIDLIN